MEFVRTHRQQLLSFICVIVFLAAAKHVPISSLLPRDTSSDEAARLNFSKQLLSFSFFWWPHFVVFGQLVLMLFNRKQLQQSRAQAFINPFSIYVILPTFAMTAIDASNFAFDAAQVSGNPTDLNGNVLQTSVSLVAGTALFVLLALILQRTTGWLGFWILPMAFELSKWPQEIASQIDFLRVSQMSGRAIGLTVMLQLFLLLAPIGLMLIRKKNSSEPLLPVLMLWFTSLYVAEYVLRTIIWMIGSGSEYGNELFVVLRVVALCGFGIWFLRKIEPRVISLMTIAGLALLVIVDHITFANNQSAVDANGLPSLLLAWIGCCLCDLVNDHRQKKKIGQFLNADA